jgi:hypothetical protein
MKSLVFHAGIRSFNFINYSKMRKALSGKLQNIPMGPIPENQSCNSTAYLISLSFKPGKTNTLQKNLYAPKTKLSNKESISRNRNIPESEISRIP